MYTHSFLIIADSIFNTNQGLETAALFTLENLYGKILIKSCIFTEGKAKKLLEIVGSHVLIIDTFFSNNENNLIMIDESSLYLKNVTFENNICSNLIGCLLSSLSSFSLFFSVYVYNFTNNLEFSAIISESSLLKFKNLQMNLIQNQKRGKCCISISDSFLLIDSSSFLNYQKNVIFSSDSLIFIESTIFYLTNLFQNKLFTEYYNLSPVQLENSNFTFKYSSISKNINSLYGGALLVYSNPLKTKGIILQNIFNENIAIYQGGSITILNTNISIVKNIFSNNIAEKGGAIFSKNIQNKKIFVSQNKFVFNQALNEGGAIKWDGSIFITENNLYFQNFAPYGNEIAAFPMKIKMTITSNNMTTCSIPIDYSNNFSNIYCISSGNYIDYEFKLEILDIYSNLVTNINGKYFFKSKIFIKI